MIDILTTAYYVLFLIAVLTAVMISCVILDVIIINAIKEIIEYIKGNNKDDNSNSPD